MIPDPLLRELIRVCSLKDDPSPDGRRLRSVLDDRIRQAPLQLQPFPDPRDDRLQRICETVLQRLNAPPLIHQLADSVSLSDHLTAKLFRDEFQSTYSDWRTRTKVFLTLVDIAQGRDIKEVAVSCGWSSPPAFISYFRRALGRTPNEFRGGALGLSTRRQTHFGG
jgi:AraC-like DNA-binding protein